MKASAAVRTAAETFVANPALDVAEAIGQLGVGEALVSTLQDAGGRRGVPMPVQRTLVAPPRCRMGPITPAERARAIAGSPVAGKYDTAVDRDSAAEMLARKAQAADAKSEAPPVPAPESEGGLADRIGEWMWGTKRRQGAVETMGKQVARTIGSQLGRRIVRGILGGMSGGR
jgi:hypothetical protein